MPQMSLPSPTTHGLRAWFLPRGARPPSGPQPMVGKTVLLVEDSRHASDAMRLMCQRLGARLRRAETLDQARCHLRTYRPDVVIVDLGLPDGRGEELIADLAPNPRGPLIVAMSGDDAARAGAMRAGAAAFLAKPVHSLAMVQAALCPESDYLAEEEAIRVDPMSLRDDLRVAADLLADPAVNLSYAAGFVMGLARMAEDAELHGSALIVLHAPERLADLQRAVQQRLWKSQPI